VQLHDQQGNIALGLIPIVVLDMWEHAFYLDYVNVKGDYVKAWWNIVNWADAAERFAKATAQTSGLIVPA
jgi:superoxide dismutase, Fe-Mn family